MMLLIFLPIILSCAPQEIYIPDSPHRDKMVEAVERFDGVSPLRLTVTDNRIGAEVVVVFEDPEGPAGAKVDFANPTTITFDPAIPQANTYSTMLHELGHVGGLGHTIFPGHLMSSWGKNNGEYTAVDILGLQIAANHCNP